uniref:Uncharacterized protein n=1 Tax=Colletotrichum fructicola (strain Nara gc5) TaxID=1213859 RepID=L2FVW5_COLFN
MSCVPPEDMIGYAQELDMTRASFSSSRPASMERQTKLAHLKLVSKYYGYANFSYPRPDGTPSRNPYRRAGQTYSSEDLSQEEYDEPSCPQTPTRRDRSSIGSQSSDGSSAPSLIDDRTDSEVSLDDDYQYHASASQLWDSFWPAEEDPSRKTPETSKTQYPALIPSPHIRRAKKTGCINYEDYTHLSHPRSAPLPPPIQVHNTTSAPKSFFDFDSDSDSDDPEPEHTISRFVKTLHKRTASEARRSTKGAAFADAQLRRARADTAETIREPEGQQLFIERHKRGFGRMFRGRSHGN